MIFWKDLRVELPGYYGIPCNGAPQGPGHVCTDHVPLTLKEVREFLQDSCPAAVCPAAYWGALRVHDVLRGAA